MGARLRLLGLSILIPLLSSLPANAQHVSVEPEEILVVGRQEMSLAEVWKAETRKDLPGEAAHPYDNLDFTIEKKVALHYGQQSGFTVGYALPIRVQSPPAFKPSCFDPAFPDPKPHFHVPLHVSRDGEFRQFTIRWHSDAEHARKLKDLEPHLTMRMTVKRTAGRFTLTSVELVDTHKGEIIFKFQ